MNWIIIFIFKGAVAYLATAPFFRCFEIKETIQDS